MIETISNGLLPVAFVIVLGWLSGRLGLLQHADARVLATVVVRFALPLALFEGAVKTSPDKLNNVGLALTLTFGLMGTYLIALLVGRFVFRHNLKTATMQALVCAYPDMAYFGAPILAAMFGPEGFLAVLIGNLITSLFMLPLTIVLTRLSGQSAESASVTGRAGGGRLVAAGAPLEATRNNMSAVLIRSLIGAVMNPIVWVPLSGAILSFCHISLPGPVFASIDMIGKAAGGASLFALGLMLYGEAFRINKNVLANLGLKNFLQPALMLLACIFFGVKGSSAHQAIITGAVPTATAAAMFALKNNAYTADATATILASTLLGIVTTGALIAVLS